MMVKRSANVIADELSLPRTKSLQTMNSINSHVSLLQESALNSLNMDNNNRRGQARPSKAPQQSEYSYHLDSGRYRLCQVSSVRDIVYNLSCLWKEAEKY